MNRWLRRMARRELDFPAVVAVGESVVGEAAGDGVAQVGGPGRVEGVGAPFDAELGGARRHRVQVLPARQAQGQFVDGLDIRADLIDDVAIAFGAAVAELAVE